MDFATDVDKDNVDVQFFVRKYFFDLSGKFIVLLWLDIPAKQKLIESQCNIIHDFSIYVYLYTAE